MTWVDTLPVLACVALFRSHLHGKILGEMERFNQSEHVFNVPDWCFSLVSCPLCLGFHFAWIYRALVDAPGFFSLYTACYVLGCSITCFLLHNILTVVVKAANTLEILELLLSDKLPKALEPDTEQKE